MNATREPQREIEMALLPGEIAVVRLPGHAPVPEWAEGAFVSVTRTPDELSIVCDAAAVPADARVERGWGALRVVGQLEFSLVGILARLTSTLAEAGVSVFVISTFDTDYVLVRTGSLTAGVDALRQSGVRVS